MTASHAKPFDFDEFVDDAPAPEPQFSAADIVAARQEGFNAALAAENLKTAQTQIEMLQNIAAKFDETEQNFSQAKAKCVSNLCEISREVVTALCLHIADQHKIDHAINILEKYLNETPDGAPCTVLLPENSSDEAVVALENVIAEKTGRNFVTIKKSAALAGADCRIEWQGGAMTNDWNRVIDEINSLFASVPSENATHGQKGP